MLIKHTQKKFKEFTNNSVKIYIMFQVKMRYKYAHRVKKIKLIVKEK